MFQLTFLTCGYCMKRGKDKIKWAFSSLQKLSKLMYTTLCGRPNSEQTPYQFQVHLRF